MGARAADPPTREGLWGAGYEFVTRIYMLGVGGGPGEEVAVASVSLAPRS
jgi:hypothetical protein